MIKDNVSENEENTGNGNEWILGKIARFYPHLNHPKVV